MYTLIFIGYLIVSVVMIAVDRFDPFGIHGYGNPYKHSVIFGFTFVPALVVMAVIILFAIKLIAWLFEVMYLTGIWIYNTMP